MRTDRRWIIRSGRVALIKLQRCFIPVVGETRLKSLKRSSRIHMSLCRVRKSRSARLYTT